MLTTLPAQEAKLEAKVTAVAGASHQESQVAEGGKTAL